MIELVHTRREAYSNTYFQQAQALNVAQHNYISQIQEQVNSYQAAYVGQKQAWDEQLQQRTEEGILQVIGGIGAALAGGALIIASFGTATPIVIAGACVVGGGAVVYGASNAAEGAGNIYLGFTGDARAVAVNPIRDTIFANNPALYYTLGNACVLAASILVPVGGAMSRAATIGTPVFQAGLTEVGKLMLSGGAGTLTSEYVSELTGSDLLGTLAGGFAGGLTYGGLNTLDTRINVSGLHPNTSVVLDWNGARALSERYGGYSDFADGMSETDRARYIQNNETKFFEEFSERASTSGLNDVQISEAFDAMRAGDYEKMASYFDTSSPVDGAVFWSGNKEGAAAYANGIGGTIMEQTPGGQVFDNWRGLQGMYPEWEIGTNPQKPIWTALSSQYANTVNGTVTYVHPEGYIGDVWSKIEKPILDSEDIIIKEVIVNGK